MEQAEREIWNDLLSERKDWEDTLADARIVCSYPEFRLICIQKREQNMLDSISSNMVLKWLTNEKDMQIVGLICYSS